MKIKNIGNHHPVQGFIGCDYPSPVLRPPNFEKYEHAACSSNTAKPSGVTVPTHEKGRAHDDKPVSFNFQKVGRNGCFHQMFSYVFDLVQHQLLGLYDELGINFALFV